LGWGCGYGIWTDYNDGFIDLFKLYLLAVFNLRDLSVSVNSKVLLEYMLPPSVIFSLTVTYSNNFSLVLLVEVFSVVDLSLLEKVLTLRSLSLLSVCCCIFCSADYYYYSISLIFLLIL
jgi:hypothetical protein